MLLPDKFNDWRRERIFIMSKSIHRTKSVESIINTGTDRTVFETWLKSCPVGPTEDQRLNLKVQLSPESIFAIQRHACTWGETFDQFVETLIDVGLQRWEESPVGSPNN